MYTKITLFIIPLASLAALTAAYISQYWFGLHPCVMCLYQRPAYYIVIFAAIVGYILYQRSTFNRYKILLILLVAYSIILFVNAFIAAYHVGIEQGILPSLEACGGNIRISANSAQELISQLEKHQTTAPCNKPALVILGISMAGWNMLYSLGLAVISIWLVVKIRKL